MIFRIDAPMQFVMVYEVEADSIEEARQMWNSGEITYDEHCIYESDWELSGNIEISEVSQRL